MAIKPVITGYFNGIIHSINGVLLVLITNKWPPFSMTNVEPPRKGGPLQGASVPVFIQSGAENVAVPWSRRR